MTRKGKLVVLSGPSGVGKSTICKRLVRDFSIRHSISCTTRPPRPGERDGTDYWFISKEEFEKRIAEGKFLEFAEVFGHLYGTPKEPIENALKEGVTIVLDIDIQGATQLMNNGVEGIYIFVSPPDMETLRNRLVGRGTESEEEMRKRLAKAHEEMKAMVRYDRVVTNDDIDRVVAEIVEIVKE